MYFNLTNKIFTKKDIVQELVHEINNFFLPHFLTIPSPPNDDSKIFPQPICSYRSHKYDNYDKTTYKVSPTVSSPRQT